MLARLSKRSLAEMNKGMMPLHWPLLPHEREAKPVNLVLHALMEASYATNIRLHGPVVLSSTTCRFRLRLSDHDLVEHSWDVKDTRKGREGQWRNVPRTHPRFSRLNHRMDRCVSAVCWHGHRDFMLHFFNNLPKAHLITKVAHWAGQDDFVARHSDSQYNNIGSQFYPVSYGEACICGMEC